jgi:CDP-diacylglycerol--serine O-phosphatidyltransferase
MPALKPVFKAHWLPNLITLANAFCGLLAICKATDALAAPEHFYARMEVACFLVFLAMVFDALDGFVARLVGSASDFGAQLDSFSDALTFGVAPAVLAKILVEHEGASFGWQVPHRLVFLAAGVYSMMAILRLVRFNLDRESDSPAHGEFKGLPSPAAAGCVTSYMWLYLVLLRPELETSEGAPTPFGRLLGWMRDTDWSPWLPRFTVLIAVLLPTAGLLMVSRVRYAHLTSWLSRERNTMAVLVSIVMAFVFFYLAPVLVLFLVFNGFMLVGLARAAARRGRTAAAAAPAERAP